MNVNALAELSALATATGIMIAGGAVRDAIVGVPRKDVDFLLDGGYPVDAALRRIKEVTGQSLEYVRAGSMPVENDYPSTFDLYRSGDGKYELVALTDTDDVDYVDGFDDKLSRMYIDANGDVHISADALDALASRTVGCVSCSTQRAEKLKAKFGPLGFTL